MLAAHSPVKLAHRIKSPLLLAYGEEDLRVPLEHGKRMRDALIAAGQKPVWVTYPARGMALPNPRTPTTLRAGRKHFSPSTWACLEAVAGCGATVVAAPALKDPVAVQPALSSPRLLVVGILLSLALIVVQRLLPSGGSTSRMRRPATSTTCWTAVSLRPPAASPGGRVQAAPAMPLHPDRPLAGLWHGLSLVKEDSRAASTCPPSPASSSRCASGAPRWSASASATSTRASPKRTTPTAHGRTTSICAFRTWASRCAST